MGGRLIRVSGRIEWAWLCSLFLFKGTLFVRARVKSKYLKTLKRRRHLNLNWEQKVRERERERAVINYYYYYFIS